MDDPTHIAAHDDDEIIACANRQRIIVAGRCARAEQQRLEQQFRLRDGRSQGRAQNGPRGYFSADKGGGGLQEPSS